MKNFTRLRRVSWKSKNNIYLYNWTKYKDLISDFWEKFDIILIPKWFKIDIEQVDVIEVNIENIEKKDEIMQINIKEIDKIDISIYDAIAANKVIELWDKYYWKNIIIFNPKQTLWK